ncbi:MAG: phage major capsid protein, partial [Clostridia bacterium]|nr:phage major capsid protein [Clostridia bacterium]
MNFKKLMERRAELQDIMENLVQAADTENRAMNEQEIADFDAAEQEIRSIDSTLERAKHAREGFVPPDSGENTVEMEERAFADYVLGRAMELRAGEQNMTMGNNGAIIPTSIANRIIKEVRDRCPILARATIYNVKGTLKIPVWGKANDTHDIAV